jgi:hypothetical protein
MSSRLVVALIWFTSGRRLAAMRAARRVPRIAPADMTPRMTEEGTQVGICRGQPADLTRIRDEEPGFPALACSALSTVRFGAHQKGRKYCDAPIPIASGSGLHLADLTAF